MNLGSLSTSAWTDPLPPPPCFSTDTIGTARTGAYGGAGCGNLIGNRSVRAIVASSTSESIAASSKKALLVVHFEFFDLNCPADSTMHVSNMVYSSPGLPPTV
jgi:hypothetical protein